MAFNSSCFRMLIHFGKVGDRTACRILSSFVGITGNWGKVTCKSCKQTSEYTYFMEMADKVK